MICGSSVAERSLEFRKRRGTGEVRMAELEDAPLQGFMVASPAYVHVFRMLTVLRSVVSLQFHCVH